jgi:ribonuclease HI
MAGKPSPAALKVLREAAQASLFAPPPKAKAKAAPAAFSLQLDIYCDGASRGNPGPAAAGAVLYRNGTKDVQARVSKALGRATNNEAEYSALLLALQEAQRLGAAGVTVHADSELVIKQLNGVYKVKHPVMRERHQEAMRLLAQFKAWRAVHVPRERNTEADRLANQALDGAGPDA